MFIEDMLNGYQDDVVIKRHTNPDGTSWAEVVEAGKKITISRELMEQHDEQWMRVETGVIDIPGYRYRIVGTNLNGDTLAERIDAH